MSIGEQLNNSKKVWLNSYHFRSFSLKLTKQFYYFQSKVSLHCIYFIEIEGLPHFKYIGKELASYFDRNPFYIYLRPFVFGFLNALKTKYNLAVYSKFSKKLLIFLLDLLQEEKEFFWISITHNIKNRPKNIEKFFTEGRSHKNVLMIDTSPKVAAYNTKNWIPIPKFTGERLDSNLLYLQKYLLGISDEIDVSNKISLNFYKSFLKRK